MENAEEADPQVDSERVSIAIAVHRALNMGDIPIQEISEDDGERLRKHYEQGELGEVRAGLYKRMGRFLHVFAAADDLMAVTLATTLNAADPNPASRIAEQLRTSQRLAQLRQLLPNEPHFRTMIDRAMTLNDRRNHVAHGTSRRTDS